MGMKPADVIVFVDPVDTDNQLMCIQAFHDFPNTNLAIVLSPRPIDFQAQWYGDNFTRICNAVGRETAIFPLKENPSWAKSLDDDLQRWFYQDADVSDSYVREDTCFYMRLCALRFAAVFEKQRISRERYAFYWDEGSLDKIQVGMRHAVHVPDFGYDFDESEKQKFHLANGEIGDLRRQEMIAVCNDYVRRQVAYFGLESADAILHGFHGLIQANKANNIIPIIEVGGPFTEVFGYIQELPVREIFAMGGYIHGGLNLFANQFNFHIDMDSAWKFLQCVMAESIPLWLLPTECAKGDKENPCPWELSKDELKDVFTNAPWLYEKVQKFAEDTKTVANINLFDWIAALMVRNPGLLPTKTVMPHLTKVNGVNGIRFRESSEGCIRMYWNDVEQMEKTKPDLVRLMKEALSGM